MKKKAKVNPLAELTATIILDVNREMRSCSYEHHTGPSRPRMISPTLPEPRRRRAPLIRG